MLATPTLSHGTILDSLETKHRELSVFVTRIDELASEVRALKEQAARDRDRLVALPREIDAARNRLRERLGEIQRTIEDRCEKVGALAEAAREQGADGLEQNRDLSAALSDMITEKFDDLEERLRDASATLSGTIRTSVGEEVTGKVQAIASEIVEAIDKPRQSVDEFRSKVDDAIGRSVQKARSITQPLEEIRPVLDILKNI